MTDLVLETMTMRLTRPLLPGSRVLMRERVLNGMRSMPAPLQLELAKFNSERRSAQSRPARTGLGTMVQQHAEMSSERAAAG